MNFQVREGTYVVPKVLDRGYLVFGAQRVHVRTAGAVAMADQPGTPAPPPVSDHRPVPRGVLPRGFQTWLMAGLALGIVLIILITGHQEPPKAPTQATTSAPTAPNPDRLRDYQERLRAMEARQAQESQTDSRSGHCAAAGYGAVCAGTGKTPLQPTANAANTRASSRATSCRVDARRPSGRIAAPPSAPPSANATQRESL